MASNLQKTRKRFSMRRMNVVNRKKALQVIKEIDAFPKVPESYKETSATGGGISIVVFLAIAVLVISEIKYFTTDELKYYYDVDTDFDAKLDINIDMTVAMPCNTIGADVLDVTGQNVHTFGNLQETDVHFDLSPRQRQYFDMIQNVNDYIKNQYHALHHVLWTTGYGGLPNHMPEREDSPQGKPDGCNLMGTLTVNKVAGNFHITAGKAISMMGSHAHLTMLLDENEYNFSHRINTFSFGDNVKGIVNPLDGDEKITQNNYQMFQYFVQVVPTSVRTSKDTLDTYMYAVTEKNRTINHSSGSHGVPGIFVKYDMSSLKVTVKREYRPYWQFLVQLCGIVGGIFATSGILHTLTGYAVDCVCCRFSLGKYSKSEDNTFHSTTQSVPTQPLISQTDIPYSKSVVGSNNENNISPVTLCSPNID